MEPQQPPNSGSGPVADRTRSKPKRDRSKEIERQRLRRQQMSQDKRDAENAGRRESYHATTPEQRETSLSDRREQYHAVSDEVRQSRSASRAEAYSNVTPQQRESRSASRAEAFLNMPTERHEALLEGLRDQYHSVSDEERESRSASRAEAFLNMPTERHEALLEGLRDQYHSVSDEEREERSDSRAEAFLNMPTERHEALLEGLRDQYHAVTDEEREERNVARRNRPRDAENAARRAQRQVARLKQVQEENSTMLQTAAGKSRYGKVYFKSAWKRQEFEYNGRTVCKRITLGPRNEECPHCGARFYRDISKSTRNSFFKCCKSGALKLRLPAYPHFIQKLFKGEHELSANFLANDRQINAALSMGCAGYKQLDRLPGPYCFRIQGGINYMLYELQPNVPTPVYNLTWILDVEDATDARMKDCHNQNIDKELLKMLHEMLEVTNPLVQQYKFVYDAALAQGEDFRIVFRNRTGNQYEQPSGDLIVAVYGDNDTDSTERGVVCHLKSAANPPAHLTTTIEPVAPSGPLMSLMPPPATTYVPRITSRQQAAASSTRAQPSSVSSRSLASNMPSTSAGITSTSAFNIGSLSLSDRTGQQSLNQQRPSSRGQVLYLDGDHALTTPLTYPLLFPCGDAGWHINRECTHAEYYRYLIAHRSGDFSPFPFAKKLFLQFLADCYCKVEANRLKYIRLNQSDMRSDTISNVHDYDQSDADGFIGRKLVKLPASFTGSPREQLERYYDAMATVGRFGKPDLFITFTCNPQWPEFAHLDDVAFHPDEVCDVFRIKCRMLVDDIKERGIFGRTVAHVAVIEHQKRGLPHAHILVILHSDDKPRTPEDVDQIISAELPDPETEPELFAIVSRHMVHRQCKAGDICWKGKDKCSKSFPFAYSEESRINNRSYPVYKRSQHGHKTMIHGKEYDNAWVVPYNWQLLLRYDAHINVTLCGSVGSLKYLYKYVYKGCDRAIVDIVSADRDEIALHLDSRYLSSHEAYWRLMGYETNYRAPPVVHLEVHDKDNQLVHFRPGQHTEAAARGRATTLTAWFKLNLTCRNRIANGEAIEVDTLQYLYLEMPEFFTWNQGAKRWNLRKTDSFALGRMYRVKPETTAYYLRIMLLHVRGATCFEDLRRVNGQMYATYKEAAEAAGYLEDDRESDRTMEEAVLAQMPHQIRFVFAVLLAHSSIADPVAMYEKYAAAMRDDFENLRRLSEARAISAAYLDIQRIANGLGITETNFQSMIPPPEFLLDDDDDNMAIEQPSDISLTSLNQEQRQAADAILNAVLQNGTRRCFNIDGPAGSGKTYLYRALYNELTKKGKKTICVAWSGIAATLLPNGRTVHSTFSLPVPCNSSRHRSGITAQSRVAANLRRVDAIIWDEVSMASKYALISVDELLRDLTQCNLPFGGKIIIVGGDFRQVLPVVPRGSEGDIINETVKLCPLWQHFQTFSLVTNMRTAACTNPDGDDFRRMLLRIGDGVEPENTCGQVQLPAKFGVASMEELINFVYDDFERLEEKTILTAKNEESFVLNDQILDKMPGHARVFASADSFVSETGQENDAIGNWLMEYVNSLTPNGYPRHLLRVKKGAIVMLLRNLDVERGLTNGTRLIVEDFGSGDRRNVLVCQIASGRMRGERVLIPRIPVIGQSTNVGIPFILRRKQFPLRLSFANTINKAQGQTFAKVGVCLDKPVFSHGQLYVSLSRVSDPLNLRIFPGGLTKNVVFRSIFF